MELNNRNGNWKEEAPALASMKKACPFTVPDNYFNELTGMIKIRRKLEEIKGSEEIHEVPGGYFDSLSERVLLSIELEKLKESSGSNPFTVPSGYFEGLQANIESKIPAGTTGKVRRLAPAWLNYAAAACAILVLGVSLFLNLSKESVESKFATLPEDDIVRYLQVHTDSGDFPVIMENMDKNTTAVYNPDLTDQEIKQYLDSTTL